MRASPAAGRGRRRRKRRLAEADYRALGQFRRAMREFQAFSEQSAREHGLTSQQHQALLAIRSHAGPEPMTIGELAQCLMIRNHTAVELVGRLVERALATRRPSSEDRRRVLLELTAEAKERLEAISVGNITQLTQTAEILTALLATVQRIEAAHGRG
jgi:DNA-binding MarR family transcriptional regulator